jgi:imidazoleglycerol-phosphate dehydratase
MREGRIQRKTRETDIQVRWNLDQARPPKVASGSGFLDHMLEQLGYHGGTDLEVQCVGDTHIDMHHSVEDIGIAMGQALRQALGEKQGIERFGFYYAPLDESLARCSLDLSGRFALEYHAHPGRDRVGDLDAELVEHFFHSLAEHGGISLHLDLIRSKNAHHAVECTFKAFARALAMAIGPARTAAGIPSTKGVL